MWIMLNFSIKYWRTRRCGKWSVRSEYTVKCEFRIVFSIIANYMIWRASKTKIGTLDSVYQNLKEQYNAASLGNAKPEPRSLVCVSQAQLNLGTAISNVYVKSLLTTADKDVVSKRSILKWQILARSDRLAFSHIIINLWLLSFISISVITFHLPL